MHFSLKYSDKPLISSLFFFLFLFLFLLFTYYFGYYHIV